jgi:hypothetical protein
MRSLALTVGVLVGACGVPHGAAAGVKKAAYPEIKAELLEAYVPDAAFDAMLARFADAVAKKDEQALFALVGPMFVWTLEGALTDEFDPGRDAVHNFKVVFGFRAVGTDKDGAVENGPFWDALAAFAQDRTFYKATDSGNRVCGPMGANAADEAVFEKAGNKIETGDDGVNWYFTLSDTPVLRTPDDRGAPVAKVGKVILPVLSTAPAGKAGEPAPTPTSLEVLLPSGKSAWIAASDARPLAAERLCYARTSAGEWKIVTYDQPE